MSAAAPSLVVASNSSMSARAAWRGASWADWKGNTAADVWAKRATRLRPLVDDAADRRAVFMHDHRPAATAEVRLQRLPLHYTCMSMQTTACPPGRMLAPEHVVKLLREQHVRRAIRIHSAPDGLTTRADLSPRVRAVRRLHSAIGLVVLQYEQQRAVVSGKLPFVHT